MRLTRRGGLSGWKQAAVGFALGALGGCMLGATEDPVDKTLSLMTAAGPLKPLMDAVGMVGPLGLGALVGAAALTTAMTSVMAGIILAAVVASVFVATRSCSSSHKDSVGLWLSAGLAGAVGTTLSGATFGGMSEWIVQSYGMVGLLWALSIFTVFKPPMRFLFQLLWEQGEACCSLASVDWAREREDLATTEMQQRQRVTLQIEERILVLDNGISEIAADPRAVWTAERREREEIERKKTENEEAEMKQRTTQDWINTIVIKHVDFLAFSGIPMTVVAVITSGFGLVGYGRHQSVFIALLGLVAVIGYYLLRSSDFKYWMLMGCMGMLATFVIALLTLHAGQEALTAATKTRATGLDDPSKEAIRTRVNYESSLEALNAALFVSRTCQLSLGATVGGALVRRDTGEVKVIAGAALVAGSLLAGVEVLAPALGEGGTAGALLGVVGAAGVSVGGVAALAVRWSQWPGTLGTVAGLVIGAVGIGKWHIVNVGLQIPVAYVFAMTNPF